MDRWYCGTFQFWMVISHSNGQMNYPRSHDASWGDKTDDLVRICTAMFRDWGCEEVHQVWWQSFQWGKTLHGRTAHNQSANVHWRNHLGLYHLGHTKMLGKKWRANLRDPPKTWKPPYIRWIVDDQAKYWHWLELFIICAMVKRGFLWSSQCTLVVTPSWLAFRERYT